MESLLSFAKGPLFRFCFILMLLGLARILYVDLWGAYKAYKKAGDKKMPWRLILRRTWEWLFPVKRITHNFQVYSVFSILFHIGLIIVPIFLFAHVQLWKEAVGVSWLTLPFSWAFWLTLSTIVFTITLIMGRIVIRQARLLTKPQDYFWLILLLIPFVTGFICANINVSPQAYQFCMVVHVLTGDLIFVLIPFTKIAHCVLAPLSQVFSALAWKFPSKTDENIGITLNKKGVPV